VHKPFGDIKNKTFSTRMAELGRVHLRGRSENTARAAERTACVAGVHLRQQLAREGVSATHGNFAAEIACFAVFVLGADDVVDRCCASSYVQFTGGDAAAARERRKIVYPLEIDATTWSRNLARRASTALIGVPAVWKRCIGA